MSHHGLFNRIFIGLLCSYIFNWLKELAEIKLPDNFTQEDWDWLDTNDQY